MRAWKQPNHAPVTTLAFKQRPCVDKPLQTETANASIDKLTAIKNNSIPMFVSPFLFIR